MHYIAATLLVVFVARLASAENSQLLFEFGADAGDTEFPTVDDLYIGPIDVSTTGFVFFGSSFNDLFVSCCTFLLITLTPVFQSGL